MSNNDLFNRLVLNSRPGSNPDLYHDSEPSFNRPRVDPSTSRVKRCLFGRGNSEENIKFAKRELEKSIQDSKKKWNFDFENEKPMEGRFEWKTPPGVPYPQKMSRSAASGAVVGSSSAVVGAASSSVVGTENVENLQPHLFLDSSSRSSGASPNSTSSERGSHTSMSSIFSSNSLASESEQSAAHCDHKTSQKSSTFLGKTDDLKSEKQESDVQRGASSNPAAGSSSGSSASAVATAQNLPSSQRLSSRQTSMNRKLICFRISIKKNLGKFQALSVQSLAVMKQKNLPWF